jgi:hypothetical protein
VCAVDDKQRWCWAAVAPKKRQKKPGQEKEKQGNPNVSSQAGPEIKGLGDAQVCLKSSRVTRNEWVFT